MASFFPHFVHSGGKIGHAVDTVWLPVGSDWDEAGRDEAKTVLFFRKPDVNHEEGEHRTATNQLRCGLGPGVNGTAGDGLPFPAYGMNSLWKQHMDAMPSQPF